MVVVLRLRFLQLLLLHVLLLLLLLCLLRLLHTVQTVVVVEERLLFVESEVCSSCPFRSQMMLRSDGKYYPFQKNKGQIAGLAQKTLIFEPESKIDTPRLSL